MFSEMKLFSSKITKKPPKSTTAGCLHIHIHGAEESLCHYSKRRSQSVQEGNYKFKKELYGQKHTFTIIYYFLNYFSLAFLI